MYKELYAFPEDSKNTISEIDSLKSLSRIVFDELLENDLLGFLLSSKHFKNYICRMKFDTSSVEGQLARELIESGSRLKDFHEATLKMYSGVYIEECQHESNEDLMRDLDGKFSALADAGHGPARLDDAQENHVEMAWKYRRHCNGGYLFNN